MAVHLHPLSTPLLPKLTSLNATLLPVRYPPSFYRRLLAGPPELVRVALDDADASVAGAVSCSLDPDASALYILTLCVAPVRRLSGIGARLVQHALAAARTAASCRSVRRVYAHVQEGSDALAFYAKMGFVQVARIENYYTPRTQPRHCVEVELVVRPA